MGELAMAMMKPFLGPKCDAKSMEEMSKLEKDEVAEKALKTKCESINDIMCHDRFLILKNLILFYKIS